MIALLLLLSSCVAVKYSHKEIMDNVVIGQTKEEIENKLGMPSEKRKEDNNEVWIYDLGKKTITKGFPPTPLYVTYFPIDRILFDTIPGTDEINRKYRYFIKVTFQNNKATKWRTQGLDFTIKEKSPALTKIAIISGITVVLAPILFVIIVNNNFE